MKKIIFTKMVGAGNDFLILENYGNTNLKKLAQSACHRTEGVGADGLLVLGKSKKADYKMRIINADGSEAEMCGNGARCMAAYIVRTKKPKKVFSIETLSGIVLAQAKGEMATVELNIPKNYKESIPLTINKRKIQVSYIDTGVPHTIVFVDQLCAIDVNAIAPSIRCHKKFSPRGTNVDFVEQINKNFIDVRTYERGVEGETRACGTGSVAAAIVAFLKTNPLVRNRSAANVRVKTKSSEILNVSFTLNDGDISNVKLKGSAKFICKGEYYV